MILIETHNSANPYLNLALEEYLVRQADCRTEEYLLLYVNAPCVVLGKNQSIYREVNFEYLRNNKLKLARRVSGGGTVYHDEGNLNFAFISSFHNGKVNNYRYFNTPLIKALNKAGIAAEMDARNNIVCNGKKLSGGAQFTNRKNILNHGTLLYSADLQMLRDCLKDNPYKVETKAVASVKSSVANIQSITGSITSLDELKSMILSAYEVKETKQLSKNEWQEVEQLASEKYATYEWVYGRSPVTTIHRNQTKLSIAEGIIIEIASDIIPNKVLMSLIGVNYSYTHIKKALGEMPNALNFLDELF